MLRFAKKAIHNSSAAKCKRKSCIYIWKSESHEIHTLRTHRPNFNSPSPWSLGQWWCQKLDRSVRLFSNTNASSFQVLNLTLVPLGGPISILKEKPQSRTRVGFRFPLHSTRTIHLREWLLLRKSIYVTNGDASNCLSNWTVFGAHVWHKQHSMPSN